VTDNLYYLMTVLPSLPALGEPLVHEDALAKIREETDEKLLLLADLIECESEIEKCALQHFVVGSKDYQPEFSRRIPEKFVETFMNYTVSRESEWLTQIYAAWFDLLIEIGDQTGSRLLQEWAQWEYSLRAGLRYERLKNAGKLPADTEALVPEFFRETDEIHDHSALIESCKSFTEPMKAERHLDQARVDFLRKAADQYSFSVDELIAYMLELRIHNRYARLSPDKGRKILEEVTAL
jgi:hypothetical protein